MKGTLIKKKEVEGQHKVLLTALVCAQTERLRSNLKEFCFKKEHSSSPGKCGVDFFNHSRSRWLPVDRLSHLSA